MPSGAGDPDGAGGYAGGFTTGLLMTGDFSLAHKAGMKGMIMGAGIGSISGTISGYATAKKAHINPWNGRPEKSIVIGEGQGRVDNYARDLHSNTISEDWPADVDGYFGKEIKSSYTTPDGMKFNAKWIELKMQRDYYIYDVGPKGSSVQSPYYNIEVGRTMVYPKIYNVTHIQQIKIIRILIIRN